MSRGFSGGRGALADDVKRNIDGHALFDGDQKFLKKAKKNKDDDIDTAIEEEREENLRDFMPSDD